jgi:hypothetical protein
MLFAFVDNLLDGQSPVRHLEDEQQAEIVHENTQRTVSTFRRNTAARS